MNSVITKDQKIELHNSEESDVLRPSHDTYTSLSDIQYNFNGSNTDGSFTVDDSNSFFSPYKILPIAQDNKYLGIVFLFHHGIVCCVYSLESPLRGDSNAYTQHTIIMLKTEKNFPKLSLFASWTDVMINPQWLELPMSRTHFNGPKDVRAIEVRL